MARGLARYGRLPGRAAWVASSGPARPKSLDRERGSEKRALLRPGGAEQRGMH